MRRPFRLIICDESFGVIDGEWPGCLERNIVYAEEIVRVGLRKSCRKGWVRWDGGRSRRASEDRGQSDLDVRRPLSKRGTLEATARQQSASGRSPVPL